MLHKKLRRKLPKKLPGKFGINKKNPYITRKELAQEIGNITEDGIKYHLSKLKKKEKSNELVLIKADIGK